MQTTTLLALACIPTLAGVLAGLLYPGTCKAKEEYEAVEAPSRKEDETAYNIWRETHRILEHKRICTAMVVLGSYLLSMICLIPAQEIAEAGSTEATLVTALMAAISAPMLIITIRSLMHNDRLLDISMSKHYSSW
jgi:hypothetical protein